MQWTCLVNQLAWLTRRLSAGRMIALNTIWLSSTVLGLIAWRTRSTSIMRKGRLPGVSEQTSKLIPKNNHTGRNLCLPTHSYGWCLGREPASLGGNLPLDVRLPTCTLKMLLTLQNRKFLCCCIRHWSRLWCLFWNKSILGRINWASVWRQRMAWFPTLGTGWCLGRKPVSLRGNLPLGEERLLEKVTYVVRHLIKMHFLEGLSCSLFQAKSTDFVDRCLWKSWSASSPAFPEHIIAD